MTELANRTTHGLDVKLETIGDKLVVTVKNFAAEILADYPEGFTLETTDGKEAMDMFYHPFTYYRQRLQ